MARQESRGKGRRRSLRFLKPASEENFVSHVYGSVWQAESDKQVPQNHSQRDTFQYDCQNKSKELQQSDYQEKNPKIQSHCDNEIGKIQSPDNKISRTQDPSDDVSGKNQSLYQNDSGKLEFHSHSGKEKDPILTDDNDSFETQTICDDSEKLRSFYLEKIRKQQFPFCCKSDTSVQSFDLQSTHQSLDLDKSDEIQTPCQGESDEAQVVQPICQDESYRDQPVCHRESASPQSLGHGDKLQLSCHTECVELQASGNNNENKIVPQCHSESDHVWSVNHDTPEVMRSASAALHTPPLSLSLKEAAPGAPVVETSCTPQTVYSDSKNQKENALSTTPLCNESECEMGNEASLNDGLYNVEESPRVFEKNMDASSDVEESPRVFEKNMDASSDVEESPGVFEKNIDASSDVEESPGVFEKNIDASSDVEESPRVFEKNMDASSDVEESGVFEKNMDASSDVEESPHVFEKNIDASSDVEESPRVFEKNMDASSDVEESPHVFEKNMDASSDVEESPHVFEKNMDASSDVEEPPHVFEKNMDASSVVAVRLQQEDTVVSPDVNLLARIMVKTTCSETLKLKSVENSSSSFSNTQVSLTSKITDNTSCSDSICTTVALPSCSDSICTTVALPSCSDSISTAVALPSCSGSICTAVALPSCSGSICTAVALPSCSGSLQPHSDSTCTGTVYLPAFSPAGRYEQTTAVVYSDTPTSTASSHQKQSLEGFCGSATIGLDSSDRKWSSDNSTDKVVQAAQNTDVASDWSSVTGTSQSGTLPGTSQWNASGKQPNRMEEFGQEQLHSCASQLSNPLSSVSFPSNEVVHSQAHVVPDETPDSGDGDPLGSCMDKTDTNSCAIISQQTETVSQKSDSCLTIMADTTESLDSSAGGKLHSALEQHSQSFFQDSKQEEKKIKDSKNKKKNRRMSAYGAELRLDTFRQQNAADVSAPANLQWIGTISESFTLPKEDQDADRQSDGHVSVGKAWHEQNQEEESPPTARTRRKRKSACTSLEETRPSTSSQDTPAGLDSDSVSSTFTKRRSSLRLYRQQGGSSVDWTSSDMSESVKMQPLATVMDADLSFHQQDNSVSDSEEEEADFDTIPFALEQLYTNKNYRKPADKSWETIFECPSKGKKTSKQRLKRYIQFTDHVPVSKLKRRLKKAAQNGWDVESKKFHKSKKDMLKKLEELDNEMSLEGN